MKKYNRNPDEDKNIFLLYIISMLVYIICVLLYVSDLFKK